MSVIDFDGDLGEIGCHEVARSVQDDVAEDQSLVPLRVNPLLHSLSLAVLVTDDHVDHRAATADTVQIDVAEVSTLVDVNPGLEDVFFLGHQALGDGFQREEEPVGDVAVQVPAQTHPDHDVHLADASHEICNARDVRGLEVDAPQHSAIHTFLFIHRRMEDVAGLDDVIRHSLLPVNHPEIDLGPVLHLQKTLRSFPNKARNYIIDQSFDSGVDFFDLLQELLPMQTLLDVLGQRLDGFHFFERPLQVLLF